MAIEKTQDSAKTRAAKSAAAKAAASARAAAFKKAANNAPGSKHVSGFMAFVREQGVVGLAVGLVLGTQIKMLVDQIVISFINPFVGLILPGNGTLAEKTFSLSLSDKTADFAYGAFLSVSISFLAVAAVIYFIVKGLRLDKLDKKKES